VLGECKITALLSQQSFGGMTIAVLGAGSKIRKRVGLSSARRPSGSRREAAFASIAKINWQEAQRPAVRLEAKDGRLRALEDVRQLCLQLAEARHDVSDAEANLAALVAQRPALDANVSRCRADREDARAERRRHPKVEHPIERFVPAIGRSR
jgi:hypothetical protein